MQFVFGFITGAVATGLAWRYFHVQITKEFKALEARAQAFEAELAKKIRGRK